MTLEGLEFIRRFSQHILLRGFVRIRHYGILSSTSKRVTIPEIKRQLPSKTIPRPEVRKLSTYDPTMCPCCKKQTMVTISIIPVRGPPDNRIFSRIINKLVNIACS
jgi:hypothetical protein